MILKIDHKIQRMDLVIINIKMLTFVPDFAIK